MCRRRVPGPSLAKRGDAKEASDGQGRSSFCRVLGLFIMTDAHIQLRHCQPLMHPNVNIPSWLKVISEVIAGH